MYLGAGHGRFTLHNELEDLPHRIALLVGMNGCRQPTDVISSAINPERCEAWHTAQCKAAKQHRGGIIFDFLIRAFSFPSRNAGFVDQGYDRKTIGMTSRYYDGARGCAADIWAAEVPMDYEAKARKADRKFNGSEYVRNGPPGPVLALLWSMPPSTRRTGRGTCAHRGGHFL